MGYRLRLPNQMQQKIKDAFTKPWIVNVPKADRFGFIPTEDGDYRFRLLTELNES